MSFTELKDRAPISYLHGRQSVKANKWTGGASFITSCSERRKEPIMSPWTSKFGLQTIPKTTSSTTQPRPVFSPRASYAYKPSSSSSSSIPQRQPSKSEFYLPRSNSDLFVGAMVSRDPYAMDTPLNDTLDVPLPPPPPLLSGGRLGAIIILYVALVLFFPSEEANKSPTACSVVSSSPSWTLQSFPQLWSQSQRTSIISRTCTGSSWPIFCLTLVSNLSFCPL